MIPSLHVRMMHRCLDLARQGAGLVHPNPMVGCVIAKEEEIVGEGYHKHFGGPHAEVFALLHAGKKAQGATLFVNLEPCAHFGKTPPCVDAIIQSGIAKVVVAVKDPNSLVRGKGMKRLKDSGIEVEVGICQREAEDLNEKFFKYMKTGLPFVTLKLAQTLDGRIADSLGKSKWITSELSRRFVHQLRSEHDAVLVGARTVQSDNPELTVRMKRGRSPIRIVLDGELSVPVSRKIFQTDAAPTWILTTREAARSHPKKIEKLSSQGVRVLVEASSRIFNPVSVLKILAQENVSSVLVEGGAKTAAVFLKMKQVDKLLLFIAPKLLGGGKDAFKYELPFSLSHSQQLEFLHLSTINQDVLLEARFKK